MTAICGYVDLASRDSPATSCELMAQDQTPFGPHGTQLHSLGSAAFARNLFKLVPEDDHDRQPLSDAGERYLFVADARLDNRGEIARALGFEFGAVEASCDADLLFSAWTSWSDSALERLRGDYAFVVWDQRETRLTLVRGPLSSRPIFYHEGANFMAFASTPAALYALARIPKALDFDRASAFVVRATGNPAASYFHSVNKLEPGSIACWDGTRTRVRRFWHLEPGASDPASPHDYGEALRELLRRAVGARLRRHHGNIAAQLSSGRDSSAVAATAALLLDRDRQRLFAFTAAPRQGFSGHSPRGLIADESALAAKTASLYPNVEHIICRPKGAPFAGVDDAHRLAAAPLGHVTNHPWLDRIAREADRFGSTVMLTGEGGNFTVSAGGNGAFPLYLREKGLAAAWRLARGQQYEGLASWRALINFSVGPYLPSWLYHLALHARGRRTDHSLRLRLLRQPYRKIADEQLRAEFPDARPPRDYRSFMRHMLLRRDITNKTSLALWGLDQRDPTIDRDLVEFCFNLPAEMLISATSARPIFEAAMRGLLPAGVLQPRARGYQGADWYCSFTKEAVRAELARHSGHELVHELLDIDYLESLVEQWPTSGWERWPVLTNYRNHVLAAVSLANFIGVHF